MNKRNAILMWLIPVMAILGIVVIVMGLLIGTAWLRSGETRNPENEIALDVPPLREESVFESSFFVRSQNSRPSDMVVMRREPSRNLFAISGELQAREQDTWNVAGQTLQVPADTPGEESVQVGDLVHVQGEVQAEHKLVASQILETGVGDTSYPFRLIGRLEGMDGVLWTISGAPFIVTPAADVEENLEVNEIVDVEGLTMVDGYWIATQIRRAEDGELDFGFRGRVESIDPWTVEGRDLVVTEAVGDVSGIEIGSLVMVEGHIQENGDWVVEQIALLQTGESTTVVLVGIIDSLDPLVVNGITLVRDEGTVVEGNLEQGMLVRVEIELRSDGTWVATFIQPLASQEQPACITFSDVVFQVEDGEIILLDSPAIFLDESIQVEGDIQPGSVLLIEACYDEEGVLIIQSITVIHQIDETIIIPPEEDEEEDERGGKVTICHIPPGNPDNRHTITIDESAVDAHVNNHGDTLGPCP